MVCPCYEPKINQISDLPTWLPAVSLLFEQKK